MKYEVSANGHSFGIYEADSEQEAIDLCCQDAGYQSEKHMEAMLEQVSDLEANEVE